LGAPRGRLIRQLLVESAVLAFAGAAAGLGVAALLLRVIRALGAVSVPRIENVRLDPTVLAFALLVACMTALAFGLLPALRLTDGRQAGDLRAGGRGAAGRRTRVWGVLVGTEVALALVLLVGAGLLVRSLDRLLDQDLGFDETDVLGSGVALSPLAYPELEDHRQFWDALLARLEAEPDVAAAGVVSTIPMRGSAPNGRLELAGGDATETDAVYVLMSEGAFAALDVPLVSGRLFGPGDGPDDPHVVVVNRTFAESVFPGEDPLGKRVSGGGMDNWWDADPPRFATIVGVVGDVRYRDLARGPEPVVYFNPRQRPFRISFGGTVLVEAASGDAASLGPTLRAVLREADPDVAVEPRTLADVVSASLAQRRFLLSILGGFSVLALVLAGVGIYGVVAYAVARRTREIGVRLAMGAPPARVRRQVLAGALSTVAVGLVLGVVGGILLTRLLQGFLFGVSATDPVTFGAMAGLLLGCALLASWIPARRATRVDPMITMRAE
jgi:predicted permease